MISAKSLIKFLQLNLVKITASDGSVPKGLTGCNLVTLFSAVYS